MRSRRRGRSGQAMVEFSIVFVLFMVCLLATIQAAFWAMDSMAAVTAVENGARIAALPLQPSEGGNPSSQAPAAFNPATGLGGIDQTVVKELTAGMISTPVINWNQQVATLRFSASQLGLAAGQCPTPAMVLEEEGGPGVAICSSYWAPGTSQAARLCPASASTTGCVQVEVAGYARLLVTTAIVSLGLGQQCASLPGSSGIGFGGGGGGAQVSVCTQGFPMMDEATVPAETYTQ